MKYYIINHEDGFFSINSKKDGTGFLLNISKDIKEFSEAKLYCEIANNAIVLYDFIESNV